MNVVVRYFCLYLIMICMLPGANFATIRIICTAALSDPHFDFRKEQYIAAFTKLCELGYPDFYIVEAIKKSGPTFLDDYSHNVFYATVNDPKLTNHGINEAKTLLEACVHFNFDPDDMIIKLTGRHSVTSDYLMKMVENNLNFDAFVKITTKKGNICTVGFAMRYKYLKEMLETMDYRWMMKHGQNLEKSIGEYIKKKRKEGIGVYQLNKLDIVAQVFGSTTSPGCAPEIMTF